MTAPPGFDVDGVHYKPEEGNKNSFSKKEIMQRIADLADTTLGPHEEMGKLRYSTVKAILVELGVDVQKLENQSCIDKKRFSTILPALKEECQLEEPIDLGGYADHNQAWKIYQQLKARQ